MQIETDSFTMDYFTFGRGGDALVILPGLSVQSVMGFADAVAKAYDLLADDFTVYVLDRRRELPVAYTVADMARDTAQAIRALGLQQASILGASQGGMIAMTMAIEHPDLVRKLVLCSTSACMTQDHYQAVDEWVALARARDTRDLYLAFGETIYPHDTFEQMRGFLIESARHVTENDLDRFAILAEGMKGFDVADDLQAITCPVFAIGSKDDRIFGTAAIEQIAQHLGDRKDFALHLYDGYGHAVYDLAPDFTERVRRFLVS